MYDEDRKRALEMYDEIFDEINNENAVLQLLVSPTRQAVNLARAYDARDRKYQDDGQEPAYQLVIEDIRRQAAVLMPAAPQAEEGQVSLFSDAELSENVFDSLGFDVLPEDHEETPSPLNQVSQEIGLFPDEDREGEPAPLAPPPVPVIEESAAEAPAQEVEDFSDAVDAFLADFAINDELSDNTAPEQSPISPMQDEDAGEENAPQQTAEKKEDTVRAMPEQAAIPVQPHAEEAMQNAPVQEFRAPRMQGPRQEQRAQLDLPDMTGTTKRKTNVPLLILFILLAIPVGLVCAAAILAFAAIFLGLAGLSLFVGVNGLIAAFGFSVFADILLVFGLALALTAIGLLLLWLFIWLLIGAIPGLIRSICALARKLCYKEVSA